MANKFTVSTTFTATDKMTGPMDKMGKSVDKLGKKTSSLGSKIGGGLKMMGTAALGAVGMVSAAAVGIYKFAEDLSTAGDEIAKTARSMGMSTDSLQELRYIGERSGVGIEEMTKGLTKLTLNLGETSKATQNSLAKMGLSSEMLKQAGPSEAMNLLADGMAKISDPAERAALAVDLFGKNGVKMTNVLAEGRSGLANLTKEAHRVGYVMDGEMLDNAESLNDSILNMQTAFKSLGRQLGAVFMPLVNNAVQGITEFFVSARPMFQKFAQSVGGTVSKILGLVGKLLPVLMDLVVSILDSIVPLLDEVIPILASLVGDVVPIVADFAKNVITALMPALRMAAKLIGMLADKIGVILKPVLAAVLPLIEKLGPVLERGIALIIKYMAPILDKFGVVFGKIFEKLQPVFDALGAVIEKLLPTLIDILVPVLQILGPLLDVFAWGLEKIAPLIKLFADAVKLLADGLVWLLNNTIKPLLSAIGIKYETPAPAMATPNTTYSAGSYPTTAAPISSNTQVIKSTTTSKSQLDVNFNNAPAGTSIRQTGTAPGIKTNLGRAGQ